MVGGGDDDIECTGLGGVILSDEEGRRFYTGFQLDSLSVHVGDCVRVHLEVGSDDESSAFAQVLAVFENEDSEMFIEVRWFSLLKELPASCRNAVDGNENEIVETDTLDDIPAGAVSEVIRIANASQFQSTSASNDYVCRYLFTSKSRSLQRVNPRTIRERGIRSSFFSHVYSSILEKETRKLDHDAFSVAIQRLHISVVPKNLPCRDSEKSNVTEFIRKRIMERESSGPLFLCGMPGTGKTATVLSSIQALRDEVERGNLPDFNFTEINCLHLKHPVDAFTQLWRGLSGDHVAAKSASTKLKQYFDVGVMRTGEEKPMLVCLVDEFDYLLTKDYQVLFSFLDWSRSRNSMRGFLLIGIANTLDLLEQLSQRIVSRVKIEFSRISFPPYTFEQVHIILKQRLAELNLPGFEPRVQELIARKAAAAAGDLRAGLKICRKSISLCRDFLENTHGIPVSAIEQGAAVTIPVPKILGLVQEAVEGYKQSPFIVGISTLCELEIALLICFCEERRRVCGDEQASISVASMTAVAAWDHLESLLRKVTANQFFDSVDCKAADQKIDLVFPPFYVCREALQSLLDRGVLRSKTTYMSFGKPVVSFYLSDRVVLSDVIASLKGRPWEKYFAKAF